MSKDCTNDSMLDVFVFEMSQLIDQLEEQILINEKVHCFPDTAINEIFRIMHTLKGSSAMMSFESISSLAHCMEDLFSCIRNEKKMMVDHTTLVDLLLKCVDFFKEEEGKISSGKISDGDNGGLIGEIRGYLPKKQDCRNEIVISPGSFISAEQFKAQYSEETCGHFKVHISFDEGISMENMHAYSVVHNLLKDCREIYYYPPDITDNNDSAQVIRQVGFFICISTNKGYDELHQCLEQAIFVKEFILEQLCDNAEFEAAVNEMGKNTMAKPETVKCGETVSKEEGSQDRQATNTQQSIISVKVNKLDKLMDLVSEMVIAEAMVIENSDLSGLKLNNFYKSARQLNKITSEIQDMVMSIRMVPLAATFHRMHRVVRDMNKKLGKEVVLEIIGEETEVDKNIIEHISDPLMHLVRNAVDHGIELSDIRVKKGKSRAGKISLEAKNAGSEVLVMIRDDGQGLDRDKILIKAEKMKLVNKQESEISDRELYGFIFLPGFSTNDEVTEYSGRGVGMDVVTRNMELVGGSVSVDSTPDNGTAITMKIPLTLAIIDGMNIMVGNSYYTIPTVSIKEFFRPEPGSILIDPHGNEMIMVRGKCFPILKLYEVFAVKEAVKVYTQGIIIMVEVDGRMFCIFADELLGQQQVVVKALPEYIRRSRKIKGLSGCTLLGNGSISLILDIAALSISI